MYYPGSYRYSYLLLLHHQLPEAVPHLDSHHRQDVMRTGILLLRLHPRRSRLKEMMDM